VGDREIALGGRAFDVLLALIQRRDRVVGKDELLALAWPGLVVEENNLQVQISTLRRALGPDAIATVTGRGYRFALPESGGSASNPGLRAPLASFVGRQRELAEIALLLSRHRLVTLIGMGGIGKTRLALSVAGPLNDRFPDGVPFVDLAPLRDPPLVLQAVATALGVPQEAGCPVRESLATHTASRSALVVLDNCEHLLLACADVARLLLESGTHVTILATSREPLRVVGEATYPVAPLQAPDARLANAHHEIATYDAIRLFVDRAEAARPGFAITPENAEAVAAICRELDGIPLALELAAARVRSTPVEAIARRLGDRFRLLKGGDPTAMPRQQTLRATIDWSYELLAGDERKLLDRLSVFAGGFAVEAAEAVGAGEGVDGADVLDRLCHLADKSLVTFDAGQGRYRLLETVRQYALERLATEGGERAARDRHLAYYAALAREAEPGIFGPDQRAWYARLDSERENILAALAHYRDSCEEAGAGLEMPRLLRRWLGRGELEVWYRVVTELLASPAARRENLARGGALHAAAYLAMLRGRYEDSRSLAEDSLRIALACDDPPTALDARIQLGWALLGVGDLERAREHLHQALALARRESDLTRMSDASTGLGEAYSTEGRLDLAHPHYLEALALSRAKGESDYIALGLFNLAKSSIAGGDEAAGIACMLEAADSAGGTPSVQHVSGVLMIAACVAVRRSEFTRAARLLSVADAHLERHGYRWEVADAAFMEPFIERLRGATGGESRSGDGPALEAEAARAEALAWLRTLVPGDTS